MVPFRLPRGCQEGPSSIPSEPPAMRLRLPPNTDCPDGVFRSDISGQRFEARVPCAHFSTGNSQVQDPTGHFEGHHRGQVHDVMSWVQGKV